jgi:nicotinamidase/pyrazinamidase
MTVLIIIDMQNDFMPGGALAVPGADQIIPVIKRLGAKFDDVIATMDWHPEKHASFQTWPPHCVEHTWGAELVKGLHEKHIEKVFQKGTDLEDESYSVFSEHLIQYLHGEKLEDLYFVGVATDYCVLYSVLDGIQLGFQATVIRDACRAIEDEEGALEKMRKKGARIALSCDFLKEL